MTESQPADLAPGTQRLLNAAADADFEDHIRELLDRGLKSDSDPLQAMRNLLDMLERYFGDWDAGTLLVNLLVYGVEATFPDPTYGPVDPVARSNLQAVVSRLGGLYLLPLQLGVDLSSRSPQDWRYVSVETSFDTRRLEWKFEVLLRHTDGSTSGVVGPPVSILRLVSRLLEPMRDLVSYTSSEDFVGYFDAEAIEDYREIATWLLDTFEGSGPDVPGQQMRESAADPG